MKQTIDSIEAGAKNLLLNCAEASPGDSILLVGEESEFPYFDPLLCDDVAQMAQKLGMETRIIIEKPVSDASHFPESVSEAMLTADITLFFSRLGDQCRFIETPGAGKKISCYTLTRKHLGSSFASLNFKMMKKAHDLLTRRITGSRHYRIEAGCGTALDGEICHDSKSSKPAVTEFSIELFPVMIFPPVTFYHLHGTLVLSEFLMSTSTRAYGDSVLMLESPVRVEIKDSRMIAFDGAAKEVEKVKRHLERAAGITGGDAYVLNSWHTGINPYTFFDGDPYDNMEYWGTVAYGSPRYTHFHAAGKDPGDISIHLFDTSISFDDELFWDKGKFVYLDRPEVQALLDDQERELLNSSVIRDIGL